MIARSAPASDDAALDAGRSPAARATSARQSRAGARIAAGGNACCGADDGAKGAAVRSGGTGTRAAGVALPRWGDWAAGARRFTDAGRTGSETCAGAIIVTRMAVRSGALPLKSDAGPGMTIHTSQCAASTAIAIHPAPLGMRSGTGRDDESAPIDDAWREKQDRSDGLDDEGDTGKRGCCRKPGGSLHSGIAPMAGPIGHGVLGDVPEKTAPQVRRRAP